MNKQKLINEINKTKEHLANMEKMLAECEYERWKPEKGETYFIVDSKNVLDCCNDNWDITKMHYHFYNCFQTYEQAEAEVEKILIRRQLEDIARRLNKGQKIVWKDAYQDKYYIYLETETDELIYGESIWSKGQGVVYCLDSSFLDVAIQEIGEERLKKYLRGE